MCYFGANIGQDYMLMGLIAIYRVLSMIFTLYMLVKRKS